MNEAALTGALTTVESFVGGVSQVVAEGVTRCQDWVQQQETLCLQDKESLLQLLVRTRWAALKCLWIWPLQTQKQTFFFFLNGTDHCATH